MGSFLDRIWIVLGMSLDVPLSLWPVSLVLVAVASWSIWSLRKTRRWASRKVVLTSALSALVFIAFPVYAAAFWPEHPHSAFAMQEASAAGWPATILAWLWWGYMACMLLVPVFARHDRSRWQACPPSCSG